MKVWASSLLLCLLFLTSVIKAELDKPGLLVDPDNLFYNFHDGLKANLPKAVIKETVAWNPGWMLDDCKKTAERFNFSVMDMEVTNVLYEDCESPWVCLLGSDLYNIPAKMRPTVRS